MNIVIREFRISDLDSVINIENKCFKPEHRYSRSVFLELFRTYPDCFYVAVIDSLVVGYVICGYIEDFGHIISIAVDPDFQSRGIGKKLLLKTEEILKEKGVRVVYLEVGVSNYRAINLYLKNGYTPITILEKYYGDEDAYLMIKKLYV
ncbi:MAG: ribosomal protein S18-alanine N-acetyltransferase [Desulfurococcaceae archaeon]